MLDRVIAQAGFFKAIHRSEDSITCFSLTHSREYAGTSTAMLYSLAWMRVVKHLHVSEQFHDQQTVACAQVTTDLGTVGGSG